MREQRSPLALGPGFLNPRLPRSQDTGFLEEWLTLDFGQGRNSVSLGTILLLQKGQQYSRTDRNV